MGFYVHCSDPEKGVIKFETKKSRRGPKPHFQVQAWPYLDPSNPEYKGDFAVIDNLQQDTVDPRESTSNI